MYTVIINYKEDEEIDNNIKNFFALFLSGIKLAFGEWSRDHYKITFKNVSRKKAIKLVCKIKSIKNFDNIATYTIIKED